MPKSGMCVIDLRPVAVKGLSMTDQLMPFNEHQFDRCALWLAKHLGRPVTQYELVKFHVMTDVNHVLEHGLPVVGGTLLRWKLGPVVRRAYHRVMNATAQFEQGKETGVLKVLAQKGKSYEFAPKDGVALDEEEFSGSEIAAMQKALAIAKKTYNQSQEFFHNPNASFMGAVWARTPENAPLDWNDIIDAYDAENHTDHSQIKKLIALGA